MRALNYMIQPNEDVRIQGFQVFDIRFPTSRDAHGSDALNRLPDYSNPYLVLFTDAAHQGHGATFTLGRGNELVCRAIEMIGNDVLIGLTLQQVLANWVGFQRSLEHAAQLRWCGPSTGVIHMACVAITNAILDLWSKVEQKPLWLLLSELPSEALLSFVDFQYLEHTLSRSEALTILKQHDCSAPQRIEELKVNGLPAYYTLGWIGYPAEKLRALCKDAVQQGWSAIKVKIGESDYREDEQRLALVREAVGRKISLMVDANQVFGVREAVDRMECLKHHSIDWFEEPTSPYSVSGHQAIRNAIEPMGIRVATGENCQNIVQAAEFISRQAVHVWQLDSARTSLGENIACMLLAKKYHVTICPHAGGSGLCVMVPHLAAFNYARVAPYFDRLFVEYCDIVGEHFIEPAQVQAGRYILCEKPGYLIGVRPEALQRFCFPYGSDWSGTRTAEAEPSDDAVVQLQVVGESSR